MVWFLICRDLSIEEMPRTGSTICSTIRGSTRSVPPIRRFVLSSRRAELAVLIGFQLKWPRRSSGNERHQNHSGPPAPEERKGNKHSGNRRVPLLSNNSSPKQRPFWQMGAPTQQLNLRGFRTRKAKLAPKGFVLVASVVRDVNLPG
jgi:hypothetical protein